jgi:hypothetical protein
LERRTVAHHVCDSTRDLVGFIVGSHVAAHDEAFSLSFE